MGCIDRNSPVTNVRHRQAPLLLPVWQWLLIHVESPDTLEPARLCWLLIAEVDEVVDSPDEERASHDIPERHRQQIVREEALPGQCADFPAQPCKPDHRRIRLQ